MKSKKELLEMLENNQYPDVIEELQILKEMEFLKS
jgi:hypothetical protein